MVTKSHISATNASVCIIISNEQGKWDDTHKSKTCLKRARLVGSNN